jgi:hypothetical protein
MKFSDLVTAFVIKKDSEKVRRNTHDDFNLGPGWYYLGGHWPDGKPGRDDWTSVWGEVQHAQCVAAAPAMCVGLGCIEFTRVGTKIHAIARDRRFLSQHDFGEIEDLPAELQFIIRER